MKIILFFTLLLSLALFKVNEKPKLVLEIVVDGLGLSQLKRFWNNLSPNGIKKLAKNGAMYMNNRIGSLEGETAVMHASLSTGSPAGINGIIADSWYDKVSGLMEYGYGCEGYTEVDGRLAVNNKTSGLCPEKIIGTTVADEMVLQDKDSKIVTVSRKDRGSMPMAGRQGEFKRNKLAFWYDEGKLFKNVLGEMISTTYYMDSYPSWVQNFKAKVKAGGENWSNYYGPDAPLWNLKYPLDMYMNKETPKSWMPTEIGYKTVDTTCQLPSCRFPKKLIWTGENSGSYGNIGQGPLGDQLIADFAKAAIVGENLGLGESTDFLFIDFALDSVNHANGGFITLESEDSLYKIDDHIASILALLESRGVLLEDMLVILTADHGHSMTPTQLKALGFNYAGVTDFLGEFGATPITADTIKAASWIYDINTKVKVKFPQITADIIPYTIGMVRGVLAMSSEYVSTYGIWFKTSVIPEDLINDVEDYVAELLRKKKELAYIVTRHTIVSGVTHNDVIVDSFNIQRSSNLLFTANQGIYNWPSMKSMFPAMHGTTWAYDAVVPLIVSTKHLHGKEIWRQTTTPQIAATICSYLGIPNPSGCRVEPLFEVLEGKTFQY